MLIAARATSFRVFAVIAVLGRVISPLVEIGLAGNTGTRIAARRIDTLQLRPVAERARGIAAIIIGRAADRVFGQARVGRLMA